MHGCFAMLKQINVRTVIQRAKLTRTGVRRAPLVAEIHHKKDTYPNYFVRKLRGDIKNFKNNNLLCSIGTKILNWGILQFRKIFF
jgi:hypothetical protein